MEGPVEGGGEAVVVGGGAAAEEAEDVLVPEVEPQEAVVVWGWPGCGGRRGCARGRLSPGRSEAPVKGLSLGPVAARFELADEEEVEEGGDGEEDYEGD